MTLLLLEMTPGRPQMREAISAGNSGMSSDHRPSSSKPWDISWPRMLPMLPKLRASDSDASKKGACTSRGPAHSVGGFEEVPATKSKALLSATEKAFSLCTDAAIFIRAERPGGCRRGSRARFGPARRRRSPAELRPLRTIPAQCAQHSRRSRLRSHRAALHTTRHRSEGSVGVLPLDTCKSMRITESRMSSGRTCATARPTHNASDSGRHSCSHRVARTSSGLTPSQSKRSGTSANCRPPHPSRRHHNFPQLRTLTPHVRGFRPQPAPGRGPQAMRLWPCYGPQAHHQLASSS